MIPGIKFDLDKDIGAHYHKWLIYNVEESKLAVKKVKENEFLRQQLRFVMTGDLSYIEEKEKEGRKILGKKRKFRGFGNTKPKAKRFKL